MAGSSNALPVAVRWDDVGFEKLRPLAISASAIGHSGLFRALQARLDFLIKAGNDITPFELLCPPGSASAESPADAGRALQFTNCRCQVHHALILCSSRNRDDPAARFIDHFCGPAKIKANDRESMRQRLQNNISTGIMQTWKKEKIVFTIDLIDLVVVNPAAPEDDVRNSKLFRKISPVTLLRTSPDHCEAHIMTSRTSESHRSQTQPHSFPIHELAGVKNPQRTIAPPFCARNGQSTRCAKLEAHAHFVPAGLL